MGELKKVNRQKAVKFDEVGKRIEGKFIRKRLVDTDYGDQNVYDFVDESAGTEQCFYGSTVINELMSRVEVGQRFAIEFVGVDKRTKLFDLYL